MGRALSDMRLGSTAFKNLEKMSVKYTQEGDNVSPPLNWKNAPQGTRSFAIICHDPDAPRVSPGAYGVVHLVIYNIPASVSNLSEGTEDYTGGINEAQETGYMGPMPLADHGLHHYYFWLLALDEELDLEPNLTMGQLLERIEPTIIGMNRLVGLYER